MNANTIRMEQGRLCTSCKEVQTPVCCKERCSFYFEALRIDPILACAQCEDVLQCQKRERYSP